MYILIPTARSKGWMNVIALQINGLKRAWKEGAERKQRALRKENIQFCEVENKQVDCSHGISHETQLNRAKDTEYVSSDRPSLFSGRSFSAYYASFSERWNMIILVAINGNDQNSGFLLFSFAPTRTGKSVSRLILRHNHQKQILQNPTLRTLHLNDPA